MKDQSDDDPVRELDELLDDFLDTLERVAYAIIAFCVTTLLATHLLHIDHAGAYEVGMLNAGLAYYSHSATGRIIRAVTQLLRTRHEAIRAHVRRTR